MLIPMMGQRPEVRFPLTSLAPIAAFFDSVDAAGDMSATIGNAWWKDSSVTSRSLVAVWFNIESATAVPGTQYRLTRRGVLQSGGQPIEPDTVIAQSLVFPDGVAPSVTGPGMSRFAFSAPAPVAYNEQLSLVWDFLSFAGPSSLRLGFPSVSALGDSLLSGVVHSVNSGATWTNGGTGGAITCALEFADGTFGAIFDQCPADTVTTPVAVGDGLGLDMVLSRGLEVYGLWFEIISGDQDIPAELFETRLRLYNADTEEVLASFTIEPHDVRQVGGTTVQKQVRVLLSPKQLLTPGHYRVAAENMLGDLLAGLHLIGHEGMRVLLDAEGCQGTTRTGAAAWSVPDPLVLPRMGLLVSALDVPEAPEPVVVSGTGAVDEVFSFLNAQALAGGSTGWGLVRRHMLDDKRGPNQLVMVTEDGSTQPEQPAAEGIGDAAMGDPGVLITVRGEPQDGDSSYAKAEEIRTALHGLRSTTLVSGGEFYFRIRSLTAEPVFAGFDDQQRPLHTVGIRLLRLVT